MQSLIFNEEVLKNNTIQINKKEGIKSIEEIDRQIKILEEKLKNVKGTETEVYTRIVGYHRDVKNWNKGKKEEYNKRVTFDLKLEKIKEKIDSSFSDTTITENKDDIPMNTEVAFYKVFHSHLCRKCPSVLEFLRSLNIPGEEIDISTESGLNSSKKYNIMSTPSVVLFDKEDKIITIVNGLEKLKKIFSK